MDDVSGKYAEKIWDMANGVAAFSVAQGTAFAIASQGKEIASQICSDGGWYAASVGIIAFSVLYSLAISFLHRKFAQLRGLAARPDASDDSITDIARAIRFGQILCVWVFAGVDMIAILGFSPLAEHRSCHLYLSDIPK